MKLVAALAVLAFACEPKPGETRCSTTMVFGTAQTRCKTTPPEQPAAGSDFASRAELERVGLKQVELTDILRQRIDLLDREVRDLRGRVELLEKYNAALQDLLQHERDLGVLK